MDQDSWFEGLDRGQHVGGGCEVEFDGLGRGGAGVAGAGGGPAGASEGAEDLAAEEAGGAGYEGGFGMVHCGGKGVGRWRDLERMGWMRMRMRMSVMVGASVSVQRWISTSLLTWTSGGED